MADQDAPIKPSVSWKQANLFRKCAAGDPESLGRVKMTQERAQEIHAANIQHGLFVGPDGNMLDNPEEG